VGATLALGCGAVVRARIAARAARAEAERARLVARSGKGGRAAARGARTTTANPLRSVRVAPPATAAPAHATMSFADAQRKK
jgi:hypothetical protein